LSPRSVEPQVGDGRMPHSGPLRDAGSQTHPDRSCGGRGRRGNGAPTAPGRAAPSGHGQGARRSRRASSS
jgi:hypothetical protein